MSQHQKPGGNWWYKFNHAGKVETGFGYATKDDAAEAEQVARAAIKAGKLTELRALVKPRSVFTVGQVLDHYLESRCPDRARQPRADDALDAQTRNCAKLREWWGARPAETLAEADQDDYHAWRVGNVSRGTGHRTCELELDTLRNALAWAVRTRKLKTQPLVKAYKFRRPADIHHAREFMPRCGDEAHRIAAALFAHRRSEVHGWQFLLQCMTGLRDGESRQLLAAPARPDPLSPAPAGYIEGDRYLHVHRLKRGRNPRIRLDDPERPELRPLLDRILAWKAVRYPESKWLLPGKGGAQLTASLSKGLADICEQLELPPRHSHGCRAYYASVRLTQGTAPEDIARELGQSSGDELIRSVYGVEPDDFDVESWKALADKFTWLPNNIGTKPAWASLQLPANIIAIGG